ncbi:transposase [Saccharopolyspora soli]|uniref:transposase n=1 Tax=Saccharopolyspora soli TaxID=2926618 RepID=UPI003558D80E
MVDFPRNGGKYRAMRRLRRNVWKDFVLFLDYDFGSSRMICCTNTIEPLNARHRREGTSRPNSAAPIMRWTLLPAWDRWAGRCPE